MVENMYHINCIEGLFSEINKHLGDMVPNYHMERIARDQVLREVNEIQTGSLFDMRTLFEGD